MKVFLRDCPSYQPARLRAVVDGVLADSGLRVAGRTVLLKPSFVYPSRPPECHAVSTHPALVAAVTHALYDLGARDVVIAEDSLLGPSEVAFAAMGLAPLLRGKGRLLPLQRAPRVSVEAPARFVEERFVVPAIWMEADVFVSLPKIKVNLYTDVTLSVKNNFGFLLLEHRLPHHHYHLHRKIADLYLVRPPDFVIADSVAVGEGQGPMAADPVWLRVLLGGANGLAVDSVACRLMGFEPRDIEHLRLLHQAGAGPIDLDGIDLENPGLLAERRRVLARPRADFDDVRGVVQVLTGADMCCRAGCGGMVRQTLDQWIQRDRLAALAGWTFVVGKPVAALPAHDRRRTLVVGDCEIAHAAAGAFLPGCPVAPLAVAAALTRRGRPPPLRARYRDLLRGVAARWLTRG